MSHPRTKPPLGSVYVTVKARYRRGSVELEAEFDAETFQPILDRLCDDPALVPAYKRPAGEPAKGEK